ncbi:MAG: hypothetical protein GY699_15985 [Desulfobacteraceae bacterium]|nr:hypothetical protein [Desulfobacteraceae bacterium]
MKKIILFAILLIYLASSSIFSLDEKYYGVITKSDEIVRVISEPGLHIKVPFKHKVHLIHKSMAITEADFEVTSTEKNILHVKARIFWEVSDPAIYYIKNPSFDSSRDLLRKFVVEDTKRIFAKTAATDLFVGSNDPKKECCEINPTIFFKAKERINKLSGSFGIKIRRIDANAKVERP